MTDVTSHRRIDPVGTRGTRASIIRGAVAIASIASMLTGATPAEAAPRRAVFWVQNGYVRTGFAQIVDGRVRLTPHRDSAGQIVRAAVEGAVASVAFAPNGLRVAWFDTGVGLFREFRSDPRDTVGMDELSRAPVDEVVDRGGWLWKRSNRIERGPHTILDPSNDATPPERWAVALPPPPEDEDQDVPVTPVTFSENGRNITRYVTAITAHPLRPRAIVAVTPYTLVDGRRNAGTSYLAEVDTDLEVTHRIRTFAGARSLALSAGASRIAFATPGGSVQVRSFPGLAPIARYSDLARATVSFSPDGDLAMSGATGTVIRDASGRRIGLPDGITWFRYGPCVGETCGQLP